MVSAGPQDDVVVAKAELQMLKEICTSSTPARTPAGIIDFLHLDCLVSQALVVGVKNGYLCTALGHTVATMPPSEVFSCAYLYRRADIVHWHRLLSDAFRDN